MQGHPTIFVLLQQAVSGGCCHIIESLQVPPPDGKDQRVIIIIIPGQKQAKN